MALSTTYAPVRESGDGSKVAFDFDFEVLAASDLVVGKILNSTEVKTDMVLGVDYTVTLNTVTRTGTVTYTVAPTALQDSWIGRNVPITQPADIPTNGLFREVQVENALDRQAMISQQLEEKIGRAILASDISEITDITLPAPSAGAAIVWNATEDGLENTEIPVADLATSVVDAQAAQVAAEAAQGLAETAQGAAEVAQAAAEAAAASVPTLLEILAAQMPVGTVYSNETDSRNPSVIFGFGTWAAREGVVVVGYKSGDPDFGTAGATVGVKAVTLTGAQSGMPAHTPTNPYGNTGSGGAYTPLLRGTGNTLDGNIAGNQVPAQNAAEAHTNIQPSVVAYVWVRTA